MVTHNIIIKEAKLVFKNFSGKEGQFNLPGQRNFCVFLEDELANILENDGWNIRWLEPKREDDERKAYLQITVSYANFPPTITQITSKGENILSEEEINMLDWADLKRVDVVIRPYNWKMYPGTKKEKVGIKAYLKALEVTLQENELEMDLEKNYYYVPDSAEKAMRDTSGD